MKSIANRKSSLSTLFKRLQACVGTELDPTKHFVLNGTTILNVDSGTLVDVSKEIDKLLSCKETASFTVQELEQLLLETAAGNIGAGEKIETQAAAAVAEFTKQLSLRLKSYLVPFATPGLRVGALPPGMTSFRIGACEFSSGAARLRQRFRAFEVPVVFRARAQHAFPAGGKLVLPKGGTVAVVEVKTSSRYATVEAQGHLEEAYGLFVLYHDAIVEGGPGGPRTRMPLISWQLTPALAPICRIVTEPAVAPAELKLPEGWRFGTGLDQLWHKGYEVDLYVLEPTLREWGFFDREDELFRSHADTEMAARVRTALRWLTRALQTREVETQFLNLAIALEALFTAPSADYKIGALIRDCVGGMVSWDKPSEVRKLVSKLYGRRSGIVHQGAIARFTREMEELYMIVVECLGHLLLAGDHRDSYAVMVMRLGLNLQTYRQDSPGIAQRESDHPVLSTSTDGSDATSANSAQPNSVAATSLEL